MKDKNKLKLQAAMNRPSQSTLVGACCRLFQPYEFHCHNNYGLGTVPNI